MLFCVYGLGFRVIKIKKLAENTYNTACYGIWKTTVCLVGFRVLIAMVAPNFAPPCPTLSPIYERKVPKTHVAKDGNFCDKGSTFNRVLSMLLLLCVYSLGCARLQTQKLERRIIFPTFSRNIFYSSCLKRLGAAYK